MITDTHDADIAAMTAKLQAAFPRCHVRWSTDGMLVADLVDGVRPEVADDRLRTHLDGYDWTAHIFLGLAVTRITVHPPFDDSVGSVGRIA